MQRDAPIRTIKEGGLNKKIVQELGKTTESIN